MTKCPIIPLNEICRPKQWPTIGKSEMSDDGEYPVYGANGVIGRYDRFNHEKPTILIGCRGSCGVLHVTESCAYVTGNAMALDDLDEGRVSIRFLLRILEARGLRDTVTGSSQPQITRSTLAKVTIPLPPLTEQKRIAAILDKADAIRRKLQQSLRLSDDFLRSVFLDMFGSYKSPKCDRVPLGPFLEFMTSGGRGWSQYYAPSGARFIRSLDVQMNEIGEKDVAYVAAPNNAEAKRTQVRENDVLLTITGSLIGRVARVPKEHTGAYISQHVAILRLGQDIDPEFLARFLSMDEGQRLVQKSQYGQTKPGLNFDQIRRFKVPLPSVEQQKRFVEITNRMGARLMKSRALMCDAETLFSSLQQRAFRGEL